MFRDLRERVVDPLLLGGYLVLLGIGAQVESREGWATALALMALVAFFAWMMSLRRALAIGDTPTSRIGSAAQGYVELVGRGRNHPNFPVVSKLTQLPCLWYRYIVEQRTSNTSGSASPAAAAMKVSSSRTAAANAWWTRSTRKSCQAARKPGTRATTVTRSG
jgi:hypothetical protein